MQQNPIDEITRRTQRYWYEDGIWEIAYGLVNVLLGLFFFITAQYDWTGPVAMILLVLQMGVILGCFLVMNRLVKFLKERITYPRTGYVAYRRPNRSTRFRKGLIAGLMAGGIAALVAVLNSLRGVENRMPFVTAFIIAAAFIYLGYRFNLARLYLIAALTIPLGYGVSMLGLNDQMGTAAFFGGLGLLIILSGLLIILSGLVTLLIYLSRTRPAQDELADYEAPVEDNQNE